MAAAWAPTPRSCSRPGYAACFLGALRAVAGKEKIDDRRRQRDHRPGRIRQGPRRWVRHQRPSDRLPARLRAGCCGGVDGEGAPVLPVLQGHPRQHRRQAVGEGLTVTVAAARRRPGSALAGLAVGLSLAAPAGEASARPSDPGVVNYAVMAKGSVSNIVGAPMRFEWTYHRAVPVVLGRQRRVQQLGGRRAARRLRRPGPGVVQRGGGADGAQRPEELRQAGGRRVRHQRRRRPGLPPRRRPHYRLQRPDHRRCIWTT